MVDEEALALTAADLIRGDHDISEEEEDCSADDCFLQGLSFEELLRSVVIVKCLLDEEGCGKPSVMSSLSSLQRIVKFSQALSTEQTTITTYFDRL